MLTNVNLTNTEKEETIKLSNIKTNYLLYSIQKPRSFELEAKNMINYILIMFVICVKKTTNMKYCNANK